MEDDQYEEEPGSPMFMQALTFQMKMQASSNIARNRRGGLRKVEMKTAENEEFKVADSAFEELAG